MFLLDGPVLIAEGLDAGCGIECVYAEPDADEALLARLLAAGIEVVPVAASALRKVLDLVAPRSVVAVVRQHSAVLVDLLAASGTTHRPLLALVGIQDPGNAGTLLRVAEASGCAGVVLTEGSVDPWNPKVVRASAGSILRVPLADGVTTAELLEAATRHELPTVATVADGGSAPELVEMPGACVLLVGSEAHGLPPEVAVAAGQRVTIPMEGSAESLNAAVAGALVAFEASRQRRSA